MEDIVKNMAIDPVQANELIANSKYQGQRPVMKSVVERYARDMANGNWGNSESKIVIGVRPSGQHLLNGQHRMLAIIRSETTQTFTFEFRNFESDHEMDIAYSLMDHGSIRTARATLHSLGLADTIQISEHALLAADVALRLIAGEGSLRKTRDLPINLDNPSLKEKMLLNWKDEIYAYSHALFGANTKVQFWFRRSPVMSVGLMTYRYMPQEASTFWHKAAQNDLLPRDSPEHQLYEYLATTSVDRASEDKYMRSVAATWNAHVERRELKKIVVKTTSGTILIKGTPWSYSGAKISGLDIVMGSK